jgi:hypothetical protein
MDGQRVQSLVIRTPTNAAVVYRLALEKRNAGVRYHAVAEEGIPFREIASVVGRDLNVPGVSKTLDPFRDFRPREVGTCQSNNCHRNPFQCLPKSLERCRFVHVRSNPSVEGF